MSHTPAAEISAPSHLRSAIRGVPDSKTVGNGGFRLMYRNHSLSHSAIMVSIGIEAHISEASDAVISAMPLFSQKKYRVTPVSPAVISSGISRPCSFSVGEYRFLMKNRNSVAMAKRKAPRVIGGKAAIAIFVEIKEIPQKITQTMSASNALFR
jgi:hypothetical protein